MKHTRFQYAFIVAPEIKCGGFEVSKEHLNVMVRHEKDHAASKLGQLIARHIGFVEQEDLDSADSKRHVLDVIAFKTDEWMLFKRDLRDLMTNSMMKDSDIDKVINLFDKLES